jgi:broad-specificity NMP kinase
MAREDFITVLCTAPPELLRSRYAAREYAQVASCSELEILQNKFIETLAPQGPLRYESTTSSSLDRAVREIVGRLQPEGCAEHNELKSAQRQQSDQPEFVLLEGSNGSGKSTLAKLLKVNLVGWHIKTLDYDPLRPPFYRLMSEYVGADRAIFDRGHFSEVVYGDMFRGGKHFTPREMRHLCNYVEGRGLVVLCEAPPESLRSRVSNASYPKHIHPDRLAEVSARFRQVIEQAGIPSHIVRTDSSESVREIISLVTGRLSGVRYSDMGWDSDTVGSVHDPDWA